MTPVTSEAGSQGSGGAGRKTRAVGPEIGRDLWRPRSGGNRRWPCAVRNAGGRPATWGGIPALPLGDPVHTFSASFHRPHTSRPARTPLCVPAEPLPRGVGHAGRGSGMPYRGAGGAPATTGGPSAVRTAHDGRPAAPSDAGTRRPFRRRGGRRRRRGRAPAGAGGPRPHLAPRPPQQPRPRLPRRAGAAGSGRGLPAVPPPGRAPAAPAARGGARQARANRILGEETCASRRPPVPRAGRAPPEEGPETYSRTTAAVRTSACSRTTT